MSKAVFYSSLIILEEFDLHLRAQSLAEHEVLSLLNDLEETLHARALDFILEELPTEHHEEFLILFSQNPADESHWDFLHAKSPSLRDRVVVKLNEFKTNLLAELKA